jgi:RNA polymerase sigma factor (sigma-70 family)
VLVRRTLVGTNTDQALAELYRRSFQSFLAGAAAVVGSADAALDVVQESFARALRGRRQFRGDGPLEAWVWRIVINVARDTARRRRLPAPPVEELVEVAAATLPDALSAQLRSELRELPDRQRTAVFLHYYADLPYEEVATLLGVAPGTVAASLNAARATLRRRIKEAYE